MFEKGDKIGEERQVLKRQESSHNDNKVMAQIRTKEVDIKPKKKLFVEMHKPTGGLIASFQAKCYSDRPGFTIPTKIIHENNLHPGTSFDFELYERELADASDWDKDEFVDSSGVIDRVPAVVGKGTSPKTKADCRLNTQKGLQYVNSNGGRVEMLFRNLRTGKESRGVTNGDYQSDGNEIYFPAEVRENIDAEPKDTIELIDIDHIDANDGGGEDNGESEADRVDEIYDMVSEMYEAYLSNKND